MSEAEKWRMRQEIELLRKALQIAGKRCNDVHHPKHMRHAGNEPCPVEALIDAALAGKERNDG